MSIEEKDIIDFKDKFHKIKNEIQKTVIGQEQAVEQAVFVN